MHEIRYQQDMDCSSMYRIRQIFAEINLPCVFQYRSSFEEGDRLYATRKVDAEFLVPVLHVIDVSILTDINNSPIYPKACTWLSVPCYTRCFTTLGYNCRR